MGICTRVLAASLAAVLRLAAGIALGVTLGLVLAPLVVQAALDRLGDPADVLCCTRAWDASAPTASAPGTVVPGVLSQAEQTLAVVDRARRALTDMDALLQAP